MYIDEPPIHLTVGASPRLAGFILGVHGLIAIVVGFTPAMPWWLKVLAALAVIGSAYYSWRLHIGKSLKASVLECVFYEVKSCRIHTQGGSYFARLSDSSFIHAYLSVLNFRADHGKTYTLILLSDNCDLEAWRCLRVRLRYTLEEKTIPSSAHEEGKG